MTRGVAVSVQRCFGEIGGWPARRPVQGAADAMGRAGFARRERHAPTPESGAHALTRRPRSAGGSFPSRFRPSTWRATAFALAAAFALLLGAGAAQAQTSGKLASNSGQGNDTHNDFRWDQAQAFTTGSHVHGYKLTRVDLELRHTSGPQPTYTVSIRADSSGNPGSSLGTFTNPASLPNSFGLVQFTASGNGIDLAADTTYFVMVDATGGTQNTQWRDTLSNSEDAGGAEGWSVADVGRFLSNISNSWQGYSNGAASKLAIHGYAKAPPPDATDEARTTEVKRMLAAVASRTVAGALDTVGGRLGDVVPAAGLALAGRHALFGGSGAAGPDCAAGCVPGAESRGMEAGELLGSSAFSLALGAAEGEPGFDPDALRWGVWGRGDYGSFEGRAGAASHYRGETRTGWLGADARAGRWVAGLAVSRGTSETDYDGGRLETALTALWPYGRWTFGDGLELRGLAGAGSGTARLAPDGDGASERSRLTMRAGSLGVRQAFVPLDGFDLAARADASFARMETGEGEEAVDGLRADSWRLRGGLEASKRFALQDGATLTPFAELAARRDGGDGVTGSGIELAGGVRYAAAGVSVEARGRWLAAHTEKGVRERGLSATVRLDPEAGGRGLSLALTPRWGAQADGAGALWREDAPQSSGASDAGALDARLGWGFALAPEAGGLLTPFAEAGLAGGDDRRLRLGTRFEARGGALALELAGERRESAAARPEHAVRLELRVGF